MPRLAIILAFLVIASAASANLSAHLKPDVQIGQSIKGAATIHGQNNLPTLAASPRRKGDALEPKIDARNVSILDLDTSSVLYESQADKPVAIASLTKLMTAVLILEENNLQKIVEVSREATQTIGSEIFLRAGEKITIENLLHGLLINSGNDAAYVLAEQNDGIELFVNKMNKKAKELGLINTIYKDPSGLDDEGLSSANDLAIVISYALRSETFQKIIATPEETISSIDGLVEHKLENSNRLVKNDSRYPGIIGGKTGFTPLAGHSLVAAARRDGHTVVVVIINTFSQAKDASALEARKALDWAFANNVWLQ